MNSFSKATKGMLGIGILLLVGCASAPTLEFPIPKDKDKLAAFNECLVPNNLNELGKNDDKKIWLSSLSKFVPYDFRERDSLDSLADPLKQILSLHYGNKTKLTGIEGKQMLPVPFDMHIRKFPFIDSKMTDIVETLLDAVNIFPLLQLDQDQDQEQNNNAKANSPSENIAKALNIYLHAYFEVHQNKTGFVSRDGTKFQFPVQIGSGTQAINTVDHSQIGADIIRIILEAIRDGSLAHENDCTALPAVDESATGVPKFLKVFKAPECVKKWKIDSLNDFNKIQLSANAAESMVATATGKAIRGGLLSGLNNEALARTVETAIGVIARHTTERVEWCKFNLK